MSEKLHSGGEKLPAVEANAESEKNLELLREAGKKAEHGPQDNLESIKASIEAQAVSGKELNVDDKQGESSGQSFGVHKELKADAYKHTIRKIRSQLKAPDRVLSRIVHQPVVDAVSNATAKTVARPSGFLGGSIVAFIGSAAFLYMARRYGFTYNYAVVFMLFVGGFALGIILELFLRLVFRRKSSS